MKPHMQEICKSNDQLLLSRGGATHVHHGYPDLRTGVVIKRAVPRSIDIDKKQTWQDTALRYTNGSDQRVTTFQRSSGVSSVC